jgi:hypothetical protein
VRLLTNLETLQVYRGTPSDFFQVNGHLPLKHLSLCYTKNHPLCSVKQAWDSAPKSLTLLYVTHLCARLTLLPASITHLRIDYALADDVMRATQCLPHITRLDLRILEYFSGSLHGCFEPLGSFTNLHSLGLSIRNINSNKCWQRHRVLKELPEVALAVSKGLELYVMKTWDEFMGVFCRFSNVEPTWFTLA